MKLTSITHFKKTFCAKLGSQLIGSLLVKIATLCEYFKIMSVDLEYSNV